jgi:hypothetical protein
MCVLQYSSHTTKYQNAYDPIYDFKVFYWNYLITKSHGDYYQEYFI